MVKMTIAENSPYLEDLQYRLAKIGAGSADAAMPETAKAMADGAGLIQETWQHFALGKKALPGVTPLKNGGGKYAQSIKTRQTGPFSREIYSEAKVAERIENGTERVDMKKTHTRGPRSRVSQKGAPYVIIPFRWGTPESGNGKRAGFGNNVITAGAYYGTLLKKTFEASSVKTSPNNSNYRTPNARGEMVWRGQYRWGGRLNRADITDGTDEEKSRMKGMARFENGYKKDGQISKRYGGYFTFRVISAEKPRDWDKRPHKKSWEDSWIKPAMPARHVTQAVADAVRGDVNDAVESAVGRDLGL